MPTLTAYDGTELAYHLLGEGTPVVCLPGGPMQDSEYLGDLGGLSGHLRLILPDPRGTGRSATPADPTSYRCDRLVDDVEALREHLGLDRMNLLAHSAGANLAMVYAATHPEHVDKLVLVAPSTYAVGLSATIEDRREVLSLRQREPWFGSASTAFERINAGQAGDDDRAALAPLVYSRWDATAQAHHAKSQTRRNPEAAAIFGTEGAFHPETTRAALSTLKAPVLVLAGEIDANSPPRVVTECAYLFPNATLVTRPGTAHFPWLDAPTWFTTTTASFLA